MVQPQAKHCRIHKSPRPEWECLNSLRFFFEQSHTHHTGVKIKTCNSLWKAPTQDSTQGFHQGHDCCCLKAPVDWTSRWKEDGTSHWSIIQRVKSTKQTTDSWSRWAKLSLQKVSQPPIPPHQRNLPDHRISQEKTATGLLPIHFLTHPGSPDLRETVWWFRNPCNKPRNTRDSRTWTQIVRLDRI